MPAPEPPRLPNRPGGVLALAVAIFLGLLRCEKTRRHGMFLIALTAVVSLAAGITILDPLLSADPLIFLLYWAACAWLTLSALLLALYDLLSVQAAARRQRRQLLDQLQASAPAPPGIRANRAAPIQNPPRRV